MALIVMFILTTSLQYLSMTELERSNLLRKLFRNKYCRIKSKIHQSIKFIYLLPVQYNQTEHLQHSRIN